MYVWTLDAPATFDVFDADPEMVTFELEGTLLYTIWGYRQTHVNFVQIVKVSDFGKTVAHNSC